VNDSGSTIPLLYSSLSFLKYLTAVSAKSESKSFCNSSSPGVADTYITWPTLSSNSG
jgi:hypothetical protein